MDPIYFQWIFLLVFGLGFFLLAPLSKTAASFFSAASKEGKKPNVWLLTSSLVISWVFAKSITNAANLGLSYGIVGGVSYAVYYFSFLVAGVVIYQMRTQGGIKSLHRFLSDKFGRKAVLVFSLLIGFRLFNEVWSNTMIIGSYFGDIGSLSYYTSIFVFTCLTLAYTLKGGMRSSLLTDAIQMVFFAILLAIILAWILPHETSPSIGTYFSSGEWAMASGLNLFFVALLQVFSYPFHDAVLTDRGFISDAKTTVRSFLWAGAIGFVLILLFSFIGIYGLFNGLVGQAAVEVGKVLGTGMMLIMNFIMITSAASTLDSAFSSSAKLVVVDLGQAQKVNANRGRWAMVAFTILGTLPVFANPEILSATTISGTMVLGLAPVFLGWKYPASAVNFHLSVGTGILIGIVFAIGQWPDVLTFFRGPYAKLLSANIIGTALCFFLFFVPNILSIGKE